jgi:hypothetical protein
MIVVDYELGIFNLQHSQPQSQETKEREDKIIAAAPSRKVTSWLPTFDIGKKK